MNYFDLIDKITNSVTIDTAIPSERISTDRRLDETTTIDAVSFIPAHLGMVRARVKDLAKKKKDWKIEILEQENNREVWFEDGLHVIVPNEHWESFCSIFDSSLNNNSYLNLNSLLNETMEEEMKDLRRELRVSLAHLYDEAEFRQLNQSSGTWRWRFGVVFYDTRKKKISTPVTQENRAEDIQKLYGRLIDQYGEDRGSLEMLIEAIKNKKPLNTFEVLKHYDFLYATRIHSSYEGVDLYFEALVDTDYHLSETIYCPNKELVNKIQEESTEVKAVRFILYPKGGVFTPRFLRVLSDTIEDLE